MDIENNLNQKDFGTLSNGFNKDRHGDDSDRSMNNRVEIDDEEYYCEN